MFISTKLNEDLKVREVKPVTVNQQCLDYKLQCNLCDAGYVGYTRGHLHESVDALISSPARSFCDEMSESFEHFLFLVIILRISGLRL